MKIIAVIPARGGSKGLPGKNIKKLLGRPLIDYPIKAALGCKLINKVIVSTDDKKIAEIARKQGAEVPFMRPAKLATDKASSINVLLHAINFFEKKGETYDLIVMLEGTSPMTTSKDIEKAIIMLNNNKKAESIVGFVKAEQYNPMLAFVKKKGFIVPYKGKQIAHIRRQDLTDTFFPEGTLYISKVSSMKKRKTFYHDKTIPYEVERYNSFEIDEEMDFIIIEAIMKWLKKRKKK
ncbi:MAG: acylneuraminate cytidylyltransferase family protein [archaeon]